MSVSVGRLVAQSGDPSRAQSSWRVFPGTGRIDAGTSHPGPTATRRTVMRPVAATPELPVLVDALTLAGSLNITERHVRRLVAERRIPFVKVGKFVRFDPAAVTEWLGGCTVGPRR
jgi:excisionase family DNA binding protein